MQVRRLNATGLAQFKSFLEECRTSDSAPAIPEEILTSRSTSSGLNVTIHIDPPSPHISKSELTKYVFEVLTLLRTGHSYGAKGMWSWLGLYLFDLLCPVDRQPGVRNVRSDWYYVFQPDEAPQNYQVYYRHLLYTPYHVYRSFGDTAGRSLLTGGPSTGGDMIEQIAARQAYISCRPVLEALDHLYYEVDEEGGGRLKRGATSRERDGSVRRFVTFLQQIDSTYDLYGMSSQSVLGLLPSEFDAWR